MKVYTKNGMELTLKEPQLKAGAEGAVYEIVGYPNRVIKIYHDVSQARMREDKIEQMTLIGMEQTARRSDALKEIAWPLAAVYDGSHRFIGFGMKKIQAKDELDDLYVYPPEQNALLSLSSKLDVLISLCENIERLHGIGQVFGDFNPNNIKILNGRSVCFVDADSYHITHSGKTYRCVVCAPGYVAPELVSKCRGITYADCSGETFTRETDYFALAVHCFRMMMNGCHPYNGEAQNQKVCSLPAVVSIDSRVERCETPFFRSMKHVVVPGYAPDIHALPPYIYALFEKAFIAGHHNPSVRPNAAQWKRALIRFKGELNQGSCKRHEYWKGASACPYCAADALYAHNTKALVARQAVKTAPAPQSAPPVRVRGPGSSHAFYAITLLVSILLMAMMTQNILPELCWQCFMDRRIVEIGTPIGAILGIIGAFLYARRWAPGRHTGVHKGSEYILSALTSAGFALSVIPLIGLVMLGGYIVYCIFVIGIVIALLSGL